MQDIVQIIPDYNEKTGNMNTTILAARDAESAGYAHYMAKMLAATDAQREENKKLAEIRKIRRGIDPTAQQPSTMAIMARPKEDDEKHFNRPMPTKAQCQVLDKDGNVDVGERKVTPREVILHKSTQRAEKNTVGQPDIAAIDEPKRARAIDAFIYTPPAELSEEDKKKLKVLTAYAQPQPLPPAKKENSPLMRRLFDFFKPDVTRGAPIDSHSYVEIQEMHKQYEESKKR